MSSNHIYRPIFEWPHSKSLNVFGDHLTFSPDSGTVLPKDIQKLTRPTTTVIDL